MKGFIKRLLREGLNGYKQHNHKLCYSCRLKSIAINENKLYGILTEEEKIDKLGDILLILEKRIKVGDSLTKKLNSINSDLSKKLLAFFNSDKIKDTTEVDYIDYDRNDDKLFTIGYTNKHKDSPKFGKEEIKKFKINTLLRYLGSTIQDIKDYEVKNLISHLQKGDTSQLKVVSGNDILWVYNCKNYDEGTPNMGSCMAGEDSQKFLEIYTKNPNQVSCLVLINPENNKIRGRALIWTTTNGIRIMDRIYTTNDEYDKSFNTYAEDNGISTNNSGIHEVKLDNGGEYAHYPYMDTFNFYTPDSSVLSTNNGELYLTDTGGNDNNVYSKIMGISIPEIDAVYSEYYRDNISRYDSVKTWDDKVVLRDDAVILDKYKSSDGGKYCVKSEAVKDFEGDWLKEDKAYKITVGESAGEFASGDYVKQVYNKKGYALIDECVELTAGKYEEDWCLKEDAFVLLDGDKKFGIISTDDLDTYKDMKYVTFEIFEEKGAEFFNKI